MVIWVDSVSKSELNCFLRQFVLLLEASLPLPKLVQLAADHEENPVLCRCLSITARELERGATISMVWSRFPGVFPDSLISYLNLGQESGSLANALREYLDFASRTETHTFVLWGLAVSFLTIGAGFILFLLSVGTEFYYLPDVTRLFSSNWRLPSIAIYLSIDSLLLVASVLWLPMRYLLKALSVTDLRTSISRTLLVVPIIGRALLKNDLARFLRAVRIGLVSGLAMPLACRCAARTVENRHMAEELDLVVRGLRDGSTLSVAMHSSSLQLPYLQSALETAEAGGELDLILAGQAEIYVQEAEAVFGRVSYVLEHLSGLLGLALLGGFGYIAVSLFFTITTIP